MRLLYRQPAPKPLRRRWILEAYDCDHLVLCQIQNLLQQNAEYAMDGIYSVKSDVFSFRVIVLEILSGKKNRVVFDAGPHMNLLGYAWRLWMEDRSLELLDESVEYPCPASEILRCIQVGLLCVQEGSDDRLTMSSVVLMLCSKTAELPQPKRPGFCIKIVDKCSSISIDQSLCPTNEIMTMMKNRLVASSPVFRDLGCIKLGQLGLQEQDRDRPGTEVIIQLWESRTEICHFSGAKIYPEKGIDLCGLTRSDQDGERRERNKHK